MAIQNYCWLFVLHGKLINHSLFIHGLLSIKWRINAPIIALLLKMHTSHGWKCSSITIEMNATANRRKLLHWHLEIADWPSFSSRYCWPAMHNEINSLRAFSDAKLEHLATLRIWIRNSDQENQELCIAMTFCFWADWFFS